MQTPGQSDNVRQELQGQAVSAVVRYANTDQQALRATKQVEQRQYTIPGDCHQKLLSRNALRRNKVLFTEPGQVQLCRNPTVCTGSSTGGSVTVSTKRQDPVQYTVCVGRQQQLDRRCQDGRRTVHGESVHTVGNAGISRGHVPGCRYVEKRARRSLPVPKGRTMDGFCDFKVVRRPK